jgi:hypothetical protein
MNNYNVLQYFLAMRTPTSADVDYQPAIVPSTTKKADIMSAFCISGASSAAVAAAVA